MDSGLCPGNYFDYLDDDIAKQRELELFDTWNGPGAFLDVAFPPNARSLYFDPLNPPKGSIPNSSIQWCSISDGDVVSCDQPVIYVGDENSVIIQQGALGNSYLISALKLLACYPEYIKRLFVSEKFASKGLYTLKFYKNGRWRYVHIDDRMPCRQSGTVNFCRNGNPNETFAMLVEKAYAKLHGCYEAIAVGLVEKVLYDLTPAAGIDALNLNSFPLESICDSIWEYLELAVAEKRCIGCLRFVPDPQGENPTTKQGISTGSMYQIIDICITSAEPTEDLDALTIGMICVKNLQISGGRFNGRWCYGSRLWSDYGDISLELYQRTREIQFKRGLGPDPSFDTIGDTLKLKKKRKEKRLLGNDVYEDDEPDDDGFDLLDNQATDKNLQPFAEDLFWIQIEDFVDVFNRLYIVSDATITEKTGTTKRFLSKWIPGDFIAGSAGPPIVITTEAVEEDAVADNQDESTIVSIEKSEATGPEMKGKMNGKEKGVEKMRKKVAIINENFTDNPMYPFLVSEATTFSVCVYQQDLRWNLGRLGEDSAAVSVETFSSRGARLQSCMHYSTAIGFVIMRLNGLKHRVTEFKLKKIVSKSQGLQFSNIVSGTVRLRPGRYAVVPYTHTPLDRSMEYMLHFNFNSKHIEFEVDDVIAQRLMDDLPSDDEDEIDDNDLIHLHPESEEISLMSYERLEDDHDEDGDDDNDGFNSEEKGGYGDSMRAREVKLIPPPAVVLFDPAEYYEETEELGVVSIFHEVGDLMKYLATLKAEVMNLKNKIRPTNLNVNEQDEQSVDKYKI